MPVSLTDAFAPPSVAMTPRDYADMTQQAPPTGAINWEMVMRGMPKLADGSCRKSHVWFRWFNEAPVLLLLLAVVLVVVKPF